MANIKKEAAMQKPFIEPRESGRIKYSVRGVIIEHGVRESGWIFKKRTLSIFVRINDKQLEKFNNIANKKMHVFEEGTLKGIRRDLEIGVDSHNEYPVGSEIGITFGYSTITDQYLTGTTPLEITNIRVINEGVVLENEIEGGE